MYPCVSTSRKEQYGSNQLRVGGARASPKSRLGPRRSGDVDDTPTPSTSTIAYSQASQTLLQKHMAETHRDEDAYLREAMDFIEEDLGIDKHTVVVSAALKRVDLW